jgi:hypothetical protein
VETGFGKDHAQMKHMDHDPIQLDRIMVHKTAFALSACADDYNMSGMSGGVVLQSRLGLYSTLFCRTERINPGRNLMTSKTTRKIATGTVITYSGGEWPTNTKLSIPTNNAVTAHQSTKLITARAIVDNKIPDWNGISFRSVYEGISESRSVNGAPI